MKLVWNEIGDDRNEYELYPNVNHVHFFGWYIGNYPGLEKKKIEALCQLLNQL